MKQGRLFWPDNSLNSNFLPHKGQRVLCNLLDGEPAGTVVKVFNRRYYGDGRCHALVDVLLDQAHTFGRGVVDNRYATMNVFLRPEPL